MTMSTGLGVEMEVEAGVGMEPIDEPTGQPSGPSVDLGKVRELILQAHPAVIPELVQGASFDELMASVGVAEAAYARIAESVKSQVGQPVAPSVSAGQPANAARTFVVNVEELSSEAKIAEGIRRYRQQQN